MHSILGNSLSRLMILLCISAIAPNVLCAQDRFSPASNEPKRVPWVSGFQGSPDPPLPLALERAYTNLSFKGPTSLHRIPNENRFIVLEHWGKIFSFEAKENVASADLCADLTVERPPKSGSKTGDKHRIELYSVAFHPAFADNRWVFVCYIVHGTGKPVTHISRFELSKAMIPKLNVESEVEILTCKGGGHNGCTLLFDRQGYLYMSIGDLTDPSPPDSLETGQDISDLYASILRIDVDHPSNGLNYSIPQDNPFVNLAGARGEVYAYGLRNPFRMSYDMPTGELWVGDVGWEAWEMVYRVVSGGNYGWAIKEGPGDVKPQPIGPTPIRKPDIALSHAEAASVTGGLVYRGDKLPDFKGRYFFGDWITRKFWAAKFDKEKILDVQEVAFAAVKPSCFEADIDGELLVLDYSEANQDAGIYRIVSNPAKRLQAKDPEGTKFPLLLSQTGLYSDVAAHRPANGVGEYSLNAPMWVDGASQECLLAVPGLESAVFHEQPQKMFDWFKTLVTLPIGSVLAKTYSLPVIQDSDVTVRRIETQIALRDELGEWQYYTYRWNASNTDAELVQRNGDVHSFRVPDSRVAGGQRELAWQFASRTQCRVCHTPWAGITLGFIEQQLHRPNEKSDSWRALLQTGLIRTSSQSDKNLGVDRLSDGKQIEPPEENKTTDDQQREHQLSPSKYRPASDALAIVHESREPLEDRARSYLHANCAHCHISGGSASTTFDVTFPKSLSETKLIDKNPMRGEMGLSDARLIAAGDPSRSVIWVRMAKSGSGHMPHIGATTIDAEGIRLISRWIQQLPRDAEQRAWMEVLCRRSTHGKDNDKERMDAAKSLMQSLGGTMLLADALAENRVPTRLIESIVDASQSREPRISELLEPFGAPHQRIKRLGTSFVPADILSLKGDKEAGKLLFVSGVGQCSKCHRVGSETGKEFINEIGPDLSRVGERWKTREQILTQIMNPSAEIEAAYKTLSVRDTDGQVLVGRVMSRDDKWLMLRDAQGKDLKVAISEIESERLSPVSTMPEQSLAPLTAQQAADLLEFLMPVADSK